jgi:hypothetical protein
MRLKLGFYFLLIMLNLSGCSNQEHDSRLVGNWEGLRNIDEVNSYTWRQERNNDGFYTIEFTMLKNGKIDRKSAESGEWWTDNGRFYEIDRSRMVKPDVYLYQVREDNSVHFSKISDSEEYQFSEKRAQ